MSDKRSSKQPPGFFGLKLNKPFLKTKNTVKENLDKKKAEQNQAEPFDVEDFYQGVTADDAFSNSANTQSQTATARYYDNALHRFASYNTVFTLSGVSDEELKDHSFLSNPVHDIIARTGGIGDANFSSGRFKERQDQLRADVRERARGGYNYNSKYDPSRSKDVLTRAHDVFFENVNILSTTGPNSERGMANFTSMEFEIHEPYGVTLTEKIKAATFINGFDDYQDAPLLLTIEFKGFDEKGQPVETSGQVRKFPILITRVEFDVDQGGTKYNIRAVPFMDVAHDDRFKFPRGQINITADNINEWINGSTQGGAKVKGIVEQLDDIQELEVKAGVRQFKDKFEFHVDEKIMQNGKYLKGLSTNLHAATASIWKKLFNPRGIQPKISSSEAVIGENTSLVKFFEDAIRIAGNYQILTDYFWLTYAFILTGDQDFLPVTKGFAGLSSDLDLKYQKAKRFYESDEFIELAQQKQFLDWFEIKTSVETNTKLFDNIRRKHPKTIIYKAVSKKIHVLKFVRPGLALGRIDWSRYVRKIYNYIYTGQNFDVQGLRINYKSAYYYRNLTPFDKDAKEAGSIEVDKFENNISQIFGTTNTEELFPTSQEPSTVKGTSTVNPSSFKSQQFYDYITNPEADMVRIELDILGDPAYICQDQYTPIHKYRQRTSVDSKRLFNTRNGHFNSEFAQPLIQLNFRMPDDVNVNTGLMFDSKTNYSENLFFNGIYQVTKVDSSINQGEFVQTLHCVRLNNQQGDLPEFQQFFISKDGTRTDFQRVKDGDKKVEENIEKARKRRDFGLDADDPQA